MKLPVPGRTAPADCLLYDVPGPRTRRVTYAVTAVAAVAVIGGIYFLIYRPLDDGGEFDLTKWGPLVDVYNKNFDALWKRIGVGLRNTLLAAVLAISFALLIGTSLAVVRVQLQKLRRRRFVGIDPTTAWLLRRLAWLLNAVTRLCVEVFRGLPVVITIFFVARGLPEFGHDFDNLWFIVIGLTVYNGVVIGEILRSGMTSLPGGQGEAAAAIGLSPFQTTLLVLLPQAYRIMLPALISQVVVVLKDTSLGFLIGYDDILQVAHQAINVLKNPIQLYFVIGAIFIVINYTLSRVAQFAQRRLARGTRTPKAAAVLADTMTAANTT